MPTTPTLCDIDVWASELRSGQLPRVCVKSGRRAFGTMLVQFENSTGDAVKALIPGAKVGRPGGPFVVRAQLPFSTFRSLLIILARTAFMVALAAWLFGLWNLYTSRPSVITVAIFLAGFGLMRLYRIGRGRLEPTGTVYCAPSGDFWVRMHGVHPNFVAAVEAWRSATVHGVEGPAAEPQRRLRAGEGDTPGLN